VGNDGLAWVADTWNHRVVALDPGGEIAVELGGGEATDLGDDPAAVEEEPGRFFGPRSVALADGEVFVADTGNERIQVFGADGGFRRAFGGYGSAPDRLIEPVGLAVGPDRNLYVADSGNARVSVFTPAGEPVRQFPVAAWPAPDPSGARPAFQPYLAFDAAGRLYASSSTSGTVEVLTPDGTSLETLSAAGNESFEQPIGVTVEPNGELLVSDYGRSAVLRLPLPPLPAEGVTDEGSPAAGDTNEAAPTSRAIPTLAGTDE
jgi:DNA-binding beta-propeller fold protein YncE